MKKLSLLSILLVGLLIFSSCDKEELGPVANTSEPGTPAVTSPSSGESFTLTEGEADSVLTTIEWSKPDFGFPSAPTYSIEFTETGSDGFVEFARTQSTSYEVITKDINNALISEEFVTGQEHSIDLRIVASLPDESVGAAHSEPVTISITPYFAEVTYPEIYVPGGYQSASNEGGDWDPGTAPALYSVNDDDTYEGYVYMANADNQFKFTPERNWDNDWGDTGADGTLEPGGDNIALSDAGYYKMNVDLNEMTYDTLKTTWGVVGDATGSWDADQDMTYDPQEKVWTITLDLSAGEMKFRANDAWNLDYGDDEGDGRLEQGGGNIAVDQAGNYTVILDLSEAPYTYELNQN